MTMNVGPIAITLSRSGSSHRDGQRTTPDHQSWLRIVSVMSAVSALTFGVLVAAYELFVG